MAQHYGTFTIADRGQEKSTMTVFNGAITGASIAGFLTDFGALRTAVAGLSRGTIQKEMWVGDNTLLDNTWPDDDPEAQREDKLLVTYQGDTSKKLYHLTIPCINRTLLTFDTKGDGVAIDTGAAVIAFVTAFEQIARTPDNDEETVTVVAMRFVGRNT